MRSPLSQNGKTSILLAVVLFILVVAGVVVWYFVFRDTTTTPSTTNTTTNASTTTQTTTTNEPTPSYIQPPDTVQGEDTDKDGLTDAEERELTTNIELSDTDQDGLSDYAEARIYSSDPLNPDSDGDGNRDGEEVKNGYDPNGPGVLLDLEKAIQELNEQQP